MGDARQCAKDRKEWRSLVNILVDVTMFAEDCGFILYRPPAFDWSHVHAPGGRELGPIT